jgi:hypothetical protein
LNPTNGESTIDGAPALRPLTDLPVVLAVAACALLIPVQLGWATAFTYAWGFNLWQYQSPTVAAILAVALLALASRRVRSQLLDGFERIEQIVVAAIGRRRALGLLLVVVPVALWVLRERRFYGDSTILVYSSLAGSKFVFPEVGASFLLGWSMRFAEALGIPSLSVYQVLVCGSGAVAVGCLLGLGRSLAPDGVRGSVFASFVLCGGVLRVFAGHVEVYGFVIAAAAGYLWAASAFLRGRCGYPLPALVFGFGLWMHLSFAFLAPSLVLLPLLAENSGPQRLHSRQLATAFAASIAPMALFIFAMFAAGYSADINAAWTSVLSAAGLAEPGGGQDAGRELWLRGWGQTPGVGTRYTILSWPHLKYLTNSFFLLAPAAIPLLFFLARSPKRFGATPQAVFLSVAALSTLTYSVVLRPIWGPYDWDLFSLTAVCVASLVAYLLLGELDQSLRAHFCLVVIGGSLLLATIPLLLAGLATPRDAGPFSDPGISAIGNESTEQAFDRQIGPWL